MCLTTSDVWVDLNQGRGKDERAFGYVGTDETYSDDDGDDVTYCGWFFTWPGHDPARELTRDEIESMVDSLEEDETESHRESIPHSVAVESLRAKIEPMLYEPVVCPHCGKVNRLARDEGAVEGPREYHAHCWATASANMTEGQVRDAWSASPMGSE